MEIIGKWSEEETRFSHPDQRLTEQLITFYYHSEIETDDPVEFLPRFFEKASDSIRGHAIEFIGRNLHYTDEKVVPRLRNL